MNSFSKVLGKVVAVGSAALPFVALAQGLGGAPGGLGVAQGDLVTTIVTILNYFLAIAGLIAVLFLIYGGVQYIISRGEEDAVEKAKGTILYAIVGLIVIGLSATIVNFVVGAFA